MRFLMEKDMICVDIRSVLEYYQCLHWINVEIKFMLQYDVCQDKINVKKG